MKGVHWNRRLAASSALCIAGIGVIALGVLAMQRGTRVRTGTGVRTATRAVQATLVENAGVDVDRLEVSVRRILGFGPITLAAFGVSSLAHTAVIDASITAVRENEATLAPLVAQYDRARAVFGRPLTEERRTAALTALRTAYALIGEAAPSFETTLNDLLGADATALHANVAANAGLDPLLRLLRLSEAQRSSVWRATFEREAVVRNPYRWHRRSLVARARSRFDEEVGVRLTADQQTLLDLYKGRVDSNFMRILDTERSVHGDTEP